MCTLSPGLSEQRLTTQQDPDDNTDGNDHVMVGWSESWQEIRGTLWDNYRMAHDGVGGAKRKHQGL